MSARYIGVDYGTKRIGLAVSDPLGSLASPFKTVPAQGTPPQHVQDVVDSATAEFDVDEWVVGHPLNMDGTVGPQAKLTRTFARRLAGATGAPVHLWDERLTSSQADRHLAAAGLTRKKKKARRDAVAAQIILQSFLDAHANSAENSQPPSTDE